MKKTKKKWTEVEQKATKESIYAKMFAKTQEFMNTGLEKIENENDFFLLSQEIEK